MQQNTEPFSQEPLTLQALAEIIVKHYGYTEGFYELAIEFQIAVGALGPEPLETTPGVMIGVKRMGLSKIPEMNHNSVDASTVNKPKKTRSKA